jgi:hypothetical protein
MKKVLLLTLCLALAIGAVYAKPMQPDNAREALEAPGAGRLITQNRNAPDYEFTKTPTVLLENYYDYMIGSYNGLPMRVIPGEDGGYFLTYHGRRTPTGERRVFYAHLDDAGNVLNQNEITLVNNLEGYPTLGVDPVSGKPMYAWHANAAGDTLDVEFVSDAFMFGISGLYNEIQVIVDNPLAVNVDGEEASTDNEFIWPTIQIGPSPEADMRRVYVANRNAVSHNSTDAPSENILIAYADFNADMIEMGTPLEWSHTSIPEMNEWNHDIDWRRPFHSLTSDELGNLYYAGYHFAYDPDDNAIIEPDLDIFVCPNYGEGEWTRMTDYGKIPTWNPPGTPGGTGYFVGDGDVPYTDEELYWGLVNSSHLNAVTSANGKIIFPGLFSVSVESGGYYPAYHTVKSISYDIAADEFDVTEVYPKKNPDDDFNQAYTPWDVEAPWGVPEYYEGSDGEMYLGPEVIWPFPHWDETLHDDAMMFHCNNIKVTEPNEDGLMVLVWQDAMRAKNYNEYPDSYPELAPYADTPEIYISVSSDIGETWSDPIILNKEDNPDEFPDMKPMWVYPADKVITTGEDDEGYLIGKIGLMFYDDYTWGANAIAPPAHPVNDGGAVMFTELQITFGPSSSNDNPTAPVANRILNKNYPNPFNPETTLSFDMPMAGKARLEIFNVKGQLVKTMFDDIAPAGRTSLVWDSTDDGGKAVASGLYFYRLNTSNHSETRKMMLMK